MSRLLVGLHRVAAPSLILHLRVAPHWSSSCRAICRVAPCLLVYIELPRHLSFFTCVSLVYIELPRHLPSFFHLRVAPACWSTSSCRAICRSHSSLACHSRVAPACWSTSSCRAICRSHSSLACRACLLVFLHLRVAPACWSTSSCRAICRSHSSLACRACLLVYIELPRHLPESFFTCVSRLLVGLHRVAAPSAGVILHLRVAPACWSTLLRYAVFC